LILFVDAVSGMRFSRAFRFARTCGRIGSVAYPQRPDLAGVQARMGMAREMAGTARGARQGVRHRGPIGLNSEPQIAPEDGVSDDSFWRDIILNPDECTSPNVLRLHSYWQGLRGTRAMPARSDIDPLEIWSLLPNIHVSEWHENPDRVRYRLAGTEIVASIGREISGHWLTDFHTNAQDIAETLALYRRVIERRTRVIGRTLGSMQRLGVESFEWIICPLSGDDVAVTHFIGLEDYVSNKRYLGAAS